MHVLVQPSNDIDMITMILSLLGRNLLRPGSGCVSARADRCLPDERLAQVREAPAGEERVEVIEERVEKRCVGLDLLFSFLRVLKHTTHIYIISFLR